MSCVRSVCARLQTSDPPRDVSATQPRHIPQEPAPASTHVDSDANEPRHAVQNYYETRTKSEEAQKKEAFIKFVTENVNQSKADESMMISGIVTPPVAMEAKKTGQTVPQLSIIKAVPDVAFVPEATILALIAIKLTRKWHSRISHPFLKENDTPS
ncbi:hypothetical protein D0Y65_017545 [Glycine soja]|uniref:Uncharacterized protein n=1 Tax=Glycine soja TaxID=3848 RepID=A0A445JVG5_GLYSO|nr:hypothetical protein D0Y65_017545 [Glycine soja]